ncbi:related to multidrug resistant protein [Melanopsichium pennsylvanicum]|uniref:Related to multidrug resistant protein n=2 Tax=Melanopsichium pennsylvanicum TaxID=63383 RepID=A0AAJ4XRR8_9BASI|nr:related to multidrug resistant protein [Melanopsichium pennsylvanicum 4]SNX85883.1 related to multidrug resistant protein [Melanopsichium pennsylvanicum]
MRSGQLHHPDPQHPYNLPTWRKLLMLATISLTAFAANEMAAAHLTAFHQVSVALNTTIAATANTIGIGILGLGTGPLLWNALAESIGRRPAYLIAWTLYIPCNVWLAQATSFNSFAAARFLAGFTSAVSQTVPASLISETFQPEHRGAAISAWTVLLVAGPVTAPIIGAGILTQTTNWRWIYYFTLILAGALWVCILLFVPETRYIANQSAVTDADHNVHSAFNESEKKDSHSVDQGTSTPPVALESGTYGRIGAAWYPWKEPGRFFQEIVAPLKMAIYLPVILPSILYAVIFMWSVGFTVITPQVFPRPPWNFTNVQVGLSFLAAAVGALIGKFAGGYVSDWTVNFFVRRNSSGSSLSKRVPEYRLWALLPHTVFLTIGLLLYGIGYAKEMAWPVEVIGGMGVYYVANSAAGGILQTYIIESYITKAVHGIAIFNFVKCVLAFSAPFFAPEWAFEGFTKAYVVQAVVTAALTLVTLVVLILVGPNLRRAQKMVSIG